MQKTLFLKLAAIGLISLLLLIPLSLIENQIVGRSQRQAEVIDNIAQSAAGPQTLVGPMLFIQYQREESSDDEKPNKRRWLSTQSLLLPPQQLNIGGQTQVETRYRGIFHGQLFHLALNLEGSFELPASFSAQESKPMLSPRAYLVLAVSDLRGVDNASAVSINGTVHRLTTGKTLEGLSSSIAGEVMYADLGPLSAVPGNFKLSLPLSLTGTQRIGIAPVGENNNVTLKSDWPHPSFGGRFLPRSHRIDDKGFEAYWQISHLSRNLGRALTAGRDGTPKEALQVELMEPVNIYLLAERAVKYGILFVLLSFSGFFLSEALGGAPIHPMQYLLVGLALAIFFLLLIALSEHLDFAWSYLVSALACIGLISTYLSGALGGWRKGFAYGAGLTGLYGVLYGILHSEDNSLLLGSLLLFLALGSTMLGTRKLDWYRLGRSDDAHDAEHTSQVS